MAAATAEKAVATCPEIPDDLGGWGAAVQVGAPALGRRGRRGGTCSETDVDDLRERVRKLEDRNARLVAALHARDATIDQQAALLGRLAGRNGDENDNENGDDKAESVVVLRDAAGQIVFRDADLRDGEERVLRVARIGDVLEYAVGGPPTRNVRLQCGRPAEDIAAAPGNRPDPAQK